MRPLTRLSTLTALSIVTLLNTSIAQAEAPAPSSPEATGQTLEERLRAVEGWMHSSDAAKAQTSTEPAKGAFAKSAVGNVSVDGMIQMWLLDDPSTVFSGSKDSKFTFRPRRAEIKLNGEILPDVGFTIMIDPAKKSKLTTKADEAGSLTGAEVDQTSNILQDVFVDYRIGKSLSFLQPIAPNLKILVGQQKTPVTEEGYRSSSKVDMVERSIIGRTYGDKRDIGALLADSHDYFDYTVGIFNGSGLNRPDENNEKSVAGHFIVKPVKEFALGAFGQVGSTGTEEDDQDRWGFDTQFEKSVFSIKSEYARGKDVTTDSHGFYVQPGVFLAENVQAVARYDWFDPNEDQSDDTIKEISGDINYFIYKHNAKIQVEYMRRNNDAATNKNVFLTNFQVLF